MEHIVQFAIGIDEDAIVKRINASAEKAITESLMKQAARCIFQATYRGETIDRLNAASTEIFLNWLESHKDEVLRLAGEALANKMARTKAVKAVIDNVVAETPQEEG